MTTTPHPHDAKLKQLSDDLTKAVGELSTYRQNPNPAAIGAAVDALHKIATELKNVVEPTQAPHVAAPRSG